MNHQLLDFGVASDGSDSHPLWVPPHNSKNWSLVTHPRSELEIINTEECCENMIVAVASMFIHRQGSVL